MFKYEFVEILGALLTTIENDRKLLYYDLIMKTIFSSFRPLPNASPLENSLLEAMAMLATFLMPTPSKLSESNYDPSSTTKKDPQNHLNTKTRLCFKNPHK